MAVLCPTLLTASDAEPKVLKVTLAPLISTPVAQVLAL